MMNLASLLVVFGGFTLPSTVYGAQVQVVSSGYCSKAMLKRKGVDPDTYRARFLYDPKRLVVSPKNPKIPGCFHILSDNVTLTERQRTLTGEFDIKVGGTPDPSKPSLPCKKRQPKCGCGEKDACMYCDFGKSFKKYVRSAKVNKQQWPVNSQPSKCDFDLQPGRYLIDAQVCTPDDDELAQNLPAEVVNNAAEGKQFSMCTTVYMYNFRYQTMSDQSAAAKAALRARKAKGLIGCFVVCMNVQA